MVYRRYRGQKRRRGAKRRWYAQATIGKGVPFIGGTGFRIGTRGLKTIMRRQALKSEETKENPNTVNTLNAMHFTHYTLPVCAIGQGTSSSSRVGDKVFLCSLNLKLSIVASVPYSIWRIIIVKTRNSYPALTVTSWGTGMGTSDLYRVGNGDPTSIYNSDKVNIVAHRTCRLNAKFSGDVSTQQCKLSVPVMQSYQFKTDSVYEGEYYNYYAVLIPYVTTGTPVAGSTVAGVVSASTEVIFKDA